MDDKKEFEKRKADFKGFLNREEWSNKEKTKSGLLFKGYVRIDEKLYEITCIPVMGDKEKGEDPKVTKGMMFLAYK